jgi:ABC-type multidrug transport system ATPase subunit
MAKLTKVEIHHLKNVEKGEMAFKAKGTVLNIVGIYGQNGSGKTTLIDAVGIYKDLAQTGELPGNIKDYVNGESEVMIQFEQEEMMYEFLYHLGTTPDGSVFLRGEQLITAKLPNYAYRKVLFGYEWVDDQIQFLGNGAFSSALTLPASASRREFKSFLFSAAFDEWVAQQGKTKKYAALFEAYKLIKNTAFNINIHTEKMNGLMAVGNILPWSFAIVGVGGHHMAGTLPISLGNFDNTANGVTYYPEEIKTLAEQVFEKISFVLGKIVPGVELFTKVYPRTQADGKALEFQIEVLTKRSGREIPLRAESLGIQKLVSILALLVEMYNNPNQIVLIDELDSGIFEFLLGQLVRIISEGAKGQLIFTSHNLRVLEELPDEKIYFSTNNPQSRYIKIGVRESNNLRNVYLREILLNEKEYNLYDATDSTAIKVALEDANIDTQVDNPFEGFDFGA